MFLLKTALEQVYQKSSAVMEARIKHKTKQTDLGDCQEIGPFAMFLPYLC